MTVMTAMAGEILRSPDARFEGLPDFPWAPQYVEIQGLRIHRVDARLFFRIIYASLVVVGVKLICDGLWG